MERRSAPVDESSFGAAPAPTDWDRHVVVQHEAVKACQRAVDLLGAARGRNAISPLYQCRRYQGWAGFEFRASLRLLIELLDDLWAPLVPTHAAECTADVALYREAREALVELLTAFREPVDADKAAEAVRRCDAIHDQIQGLIATSGPDDRRMA